MFNLDNAIKNWKRQLRSNPAFEDGDIAELESHLREKIERLRTEGMSEEEAFQIAVKDVGEPESIGDELYKSRATQKAGPVPPWKQKSWVPALLPNYFKVAWRNLTRQKGYTFINVGGLAVGLACCILIVLYVRAELSHDKAYKYANQLIVIGQESPFRPGISTPYPLASALVAEVPMVKSTVHVLWPGEGEVSIDGQEYFEEEGVFHAGDNFFTMFIISICSWFTRKRLK